MSGQIHPDTYVTIAVIALGVSLCLSLFGIEGAIIFAGTIVVGIVLKPTVSPKAKPTHSRKISHRSHSLPTKSASVAVTARRGRDYTPSPVHVIPASPVFKPQKPRKRLKPSVVTTPSKSFDLEL